MIDRACKHLSRGLRMFLVLAVYGLGAVAIVASGRPAQTQPPPAPPTTEKVHTLVLEQPAGSGTITLMKTVSYEQLYRTAPYDRREKFESTGAITATDELGEWTFTYTKIDMNTPRLTIFGLHALGVVFKNTSPGTVEVEWSRSVLVDPRGETHPVIHRGVKLSDRGAVARPSVVPPGATLNDFVFPADNISFEPLGRSSYWSAPPLFEAVGPGMSVTLALGVKTDRASPSKTFKFVAKH